MNKLAAIYARVSSDRQKEDKTIASQTSSLRDSTHINPGSWGCTAGLDQGAGARIMNWYKSQNDPA